MSNPTNDAPTQWLWLGYDGLSLHYETIVAVLVYQPSLNQRIIAGYGSLPPGVLAVIVTDQGRYVPSRWRPDQIRSRWARWRASASTGSYNGG